MFRTFFFSLSADDRQQYAQKAGTTVSYIEKHFLSPNPVKRKMPRPELLDRLVNASEGELTHKELADYFYIEKARAHKKQAA